MNIKPLGFYVLIEMEIVEKKDEKYVEGSNFIVATPETQKENQDRAAREQDATSVGYVRAIGPTAYHGYPGCEPPAFIPGHDVNLVSNEPHKYWGLEIGQKIEYRKFEGKKSSVPGHENFRYIPDSHIIGAIDDE